MVIGVGDVVVYKAECRRSRRLERDIYDVASLKDRDLYCKQKRKLWCCGREEQSKGERDQPRDRHSANPSGTLDLISRQYVVPISREQPRHYPREIQKVEEVNKALIELQKL